MQGDDTLSSEVGTTSQSTQSNAKSNDSPFDIEGLLMVGFFIFVVAPIPVSIWIVKRLLVGPFPSRDVLLFMYISLFVLLVYELHILFVIGPRSFNAAFPKNMPKYLEYIYLVIISFGLLQIVTFPPKLSSYIISVAGDEYNILDSIRATAIQLTGECNKHKNDYLTDNYCNKVMEIANSPNLGALLQSKFIDDAQLHDHPIGDRPIPWWAFWDPKYDDMMIEHRWLIPSPFSDNLDNYRALVEYRKYKIDKQQDTFLSWLGMLLLPIGIAIRMLKTSIELFVKLK